MNQEKIGKFIATCRKDNGYTQASLAEKLGITDKAVSKWENGVSCFLQALFGQSCKTFLDIVACPNWTKLQSIWLALNRPAEQPCRHYELFTIRGTETVVLSLYPHVHVF